MNTNRSMTDEMKLLVALCNALGFEVKEIERYYTLGIEATTTNPINSSDGFYYDYKLIKLTNNDIEVKQDVQPKD